jgi:hypothetical protein
MLSILCGHWRYAHINAVRGDGINISKELQDIRVITERWSVIQHWTLLLTRVLRRRLGGKWLPDLPDDAKLLLSG